MRIPKNTVSEFHLVGAFRIDSIIEHYPNLYFSVNKQWRDTGSAASLFSATVNEGQVHYVSHSDILYRTDVVERSNSPDVDVAVAIDRNWLLRYKGRTQDEDPEQCFDLRRYCN